MTHPIVIVFFCKILQHPKINPGSAPGFGIAIEETHLKMLLVKILAENIDMKLPITLGEFSSHTINTFSSGYREYISVWTVTITYFVGENLAMNTRSML